MHHEDTRLYKTSLELVAQCALMAKRLPPGYAFLADQLRRASTSVPLNFCEGSRKRSPKDRARYFDLASGSAREVSSIVDVAFMSQAIELEERDLAKDRCDHICAMLFKFK